MSELLTRTHCSSLKRPEIIQSVDFRMLHISRNEEGYIGDAKELSKEMSLRIRRRNHTRGLGVVEKIEVQ